MSNRLFKLKSGLNFCFVVAMTLFFSSAICAHGSLQSPEDWLSKSSYYIVKLGLIQKKIIDTYDRNGENKRVPPNFGVTGNKPFTLKITREKISPNRAKTWGDHVDMFVDFYPALNTNMFFYLPTAEFELQLAKLRNLKGNSIVAVRCYDVPSNILFIEINRKKREFRFTVARTEPGSTIKREDFNPSPVTYKNNSEYQKALIQYRFNLTKKILMPLLPKIEVVWSKWTRL